MRFGTRKQADQAIEQLKAAGMKAWFTADGHHYLLVTCSAAFSDRPGNTGRISVPNVPAFIAKFSAVSA